ncbi:MAG: hydroxymethylbilane synthase [Pseudomonadota bacterium]|nr:hydroxymethylbilane synthase [Pseudomonadota bacterium]
MTNRRVPSPYPSRLVIASRESKLALWQAHHIQDRLKRLYPGCDVSVFGMTTRGDQILDRSLNKVGGKALFVKELEQALERGEADIAVHSMKDVPADLPAGFALMAAGERADPRDAFVSNDYASLAELPSGAVVGTSSLRRESQLRARFPHLNVEPLRGNVETRLRKLDERSYAAVILAAAGLIRLGLEHRIRLCLPASESIPAIGQGALGVEYRADRDDIANSLLPLADPATMLAVLAERAFSKRIGGSCDVPLGCYATCNGDTLSLTGFVASPDGTRMVRHGLQGKSSKAEELGTQLAQTLLADGAAEILAALNAAA